MFYVFYFRTRIYSCIGPFLYPIPNILNHIFPYSPIELILTHPCLELALLCETILPKAIHSIRLSSPGCHICSIISNKPLSDEYQSSRWPYPTTGGRWCRKKTVCCFGWGQGHRRLTTRTSPLDVTSSGRELFMRSRRLCTTWVSHCLVNTTVWNGEPLLFHPVGLNLFMNIIIRYIDKLYFQCIIKC